MPKTYRDLIVWQKAVQFVTEIYSVLKSFPKEELFGLTAQIKRSAISIPSNIAEGYGRKSTKDYLRFLQIAMGSIFEIQTQLEISKNLQFLPEKSFAEFYDKSREIERMLSSMISKIDKC
ncbi:MAG: four helix bundle protein [Desulfobacteraceae bacterium]|nr:four helix bundle protein [Desulfobacteraceae bacterium]